MKNVLVDTSIWSLALRRSKPNEREKQITFILTNLIREYQVVIIGPIRQELLSGISDLSAFETLKRRMAVFSDYIIQTEDYEQAAEFSNICRKKGIQGSHIDFLICSVAVKNGWDIFTEDQDFLNYQKYLPINFYPAKA